MSVDNIRDNNISLNSMIKIQFHLYKVKEIMMKKEIIKI